MVTEPLVPTFILRVVVDRLCSAGLDRDAILAEAGLEPEALAFTRLRVRWSGICDLLDAAERLTGDDRIGFHTAVRNAGEPLTAPELLFLACRTAGDAIRRVHPLTQIFGNPDDWTILEGGTLNRYTIRAPFRPAHVHVREHGVAMPLAIMRAATQVRVVPLEVRFAHAREGDPSEYEEWFGCPVIFGAGVNEVRLSRETLDVPLPSANPVFARHFEREAEQHLAALTAVRTLTDRVRDLLAADLDVARLGESTLEGAAARLKTSARTLQRGLAQEGTTFAAELDTVRRDAASTMLRAGVDIAEVSWRLGYAEPPVFHRAFRRWTGETPEGFRRRS